MDVSIFEKLTIEHVDVEMMAILSKVPVEE
jgi:hypothetical protein